MEKTGNITALWNRQFQHFRRSVPFAGGASWRKACVRSLGIITVLAIWVVITEMHWVLPALLPRPVDVLSTIAGMLANGTLVNHTISSLHRVIAGFLLAFSIGLPLGFAMGALGFLRNAIEPLIELIRPIPPMAMIPLSILWFGVGELSKVFIITYGAFFPILINVIGGVRQTETMHIKAAQSLGANRLHIFYYVTLRAAIPNIVIGMRSGISMAFICLVGSELIAANAGLGFLIQEGRSLYKTDQVLVGMIAIGLVGYMINRLLIAFENRLIRWK